MKTIEILKDGEIIRSIEETDEMAASLLGRAKLDSEVMNRDLDGEFSARFTPEIIPEIITKLIPDEPA